MSDGLLLLNIYRIKLTTQIRRVHISCPHLWTRSRSIPQNSHLCAIEKIIHNYLKYKLKA